MLQRNTRPLLLRSNATVRATAAEVTVSLLWLRLAAQKAEGDSGGSHTPLHRQEDSCAPPWPPGPRRAGDPRRPGRGTTIKMRNRINIPNRSPEKKLG